MMTREKAIKWLEETIQDTDTYWESWSAVLQKELDEQKEDYKWPKTKTNPMTDEAV